MKVLSIDVGIKNLAYCLFDDGKIILWNVINLCGDEPNCSSVNCKKKAKYMNDAAGSFCSIHAKKSSYILPSADLSIKKIKKMSKDKLFTVIKDYTILLKSTDTKKEDILKTVVEFFSSKMLQTVASSSANELNMIQIGIAIRKTLDIHLVNYLTTLDQIVIENQISPIANRMKTIQGMIAQYFIMNNKTNITFVSAANKLKVEGAAAIINEASVISKAPVDTSSYTSRKKEGIRITLELLNSQNPEWLTHFKTHKKKDDLADAFLQGKWFLQGKSFLQK